MNVKWFIKNIYQTQYVFSCFVEWPRRIRIAQQYGDNNERNSLHIQLVSSEIDHFEKLNHPSYCSRLPNECAFVCEAMSSAEHRRECSNYKINYRRITMIDSKCIVFFISFFFPSVCDIHVHRISIAVVDKTWDGDNNWLTTLLANKHDRLVVVSYSMCNGPRKFWPTAHQLCIGHHKIVENVKAQSDNLSSLTLDAWINPFLWITCFY